MDNPHKGSTFQSFLAEEKKEDMLEEIKSYVLRSIGLLQRDKELKRSYILGQKDMGSQILKFIETLEKERP